MKKIVTIFLLLAMVYQLLLAITKQKRTVPPVNHVSRCRLSLPQSSQIK